MAKKILSPEPVRRKRRVPGFVFVALGLALLGALYLSRGWRSVSSSPPPVPAIAGAVGAGRPVIFLGLDGADWELLDLYAASGVMPNLAALLAEGRAGVLVSQEPPLSPLLWTTMMTGASPIQHGILDFTRFDPSGAREPIGSSERRLPALWNMATAADKRVAVLGLWATWPAEPVNGLVVTDRLVSAETKATPPPEAVWPPEREAWALRILAEEAQNLGRSALAAYLPWLKDADLAAAQAVREPLSDPVAGLARILLETRAIHRMAKEWLAEEPTDIAIIYFQGTDLVGHLFAPFAPPRQGSISESDFARFSAVPERYFREIDRYLGEYREWARERGAVLMLASDHGFQWREGRPRRLAPTAAATAGRWHRKEGISLLWGPGIEPGLREAASIQRVAATLLALAGLPAGASIEGPPLPGVAASGATVDYGPSYRQRQDASRATELDEAAIARLKALGYLGAKEGERGRAPAPEGEQSRTPGSYNNEGLILRGFGETARAEQAFERALLLDPKSASALWNLSDLLFSEGRERDRADELLLSAVAAGLPDGAEHVVGRARAWRTLGFPARGFGLLDGALERQPNDPMLRLWRGRFRLEEPNCAAALADFVQVVALLPDEPMGHASLGLARGCAGDLAGARAALLRSLELDPNQPAVREYLESLAGI